MPFYGVVMDSDAGIMYRRTRKTAFQNVAASKFVKLCSAELSEHSYRIYKSCSGINPIIALSCSKRRVRVHSFNVSNTNGSLRLPSVECYRKFR